MHPPLYKKGGDSLGDFVFRKKLEVGPTGELTLNITSTWALTVSEVKHDKGAGTYYETPVVHLRVSEDRNGRRNWNIPNDGAQLLRLIVIGDDIGVSWGAISETVRGAVRD